MTQTSPMWHRTHTLGELNKSHVGQDVILTGWVNRHRDHGQFIFLDLRDRYGITQIAFNMDVNKDLCGKRKWICHF